MQAQMRKHWKLRNSRLLSWNFIDVRESASLLALFLFFSSATVLACCTTKALGDEPDRRFSYGITGSAHSDETENPSHYFRLPEVQKLIVDMVPAPVPVAEIRERMADVDGATAEDLFRTGLLREERDLAFINFALNTEEDIRTIRSVIRDPLESLTRSYFERSNEISEILDAYPAKTVPKGALAFIILGAFSLDWDGLYITAEEGYRARPPQSRGHFFRADEQSKNIDMREIYKGSHNLPAGSYRFSLPFDSTFTTFGDHFRPGRAGFPDIFWQPLDWYVEEERAVVEALEAFSDDEASEGGFVSEQTAVEIAEILYALRRAPSYFEELRSVSGLDTEHLSHVLNLLDEIEYVEKLSDGKYVLLIPVFDHDDQEMIDELLVLSSRNIEDWLASNYDAIKDGLANTTAMRHGVSYDEFFSNVWHHIFGLQNREMARAGLFAHPYGIDRKYKGFYPALWRSKLYDFCGKAIFSCEE